MSENLEIEQLMPWSKDFTADCCIHPKK